MTRATRSQAVHPPHRSPELSSQSVSVKKLKDSKKRKRSNVADDEHEQSRFKKQARVSSVSAAEDSTLDSEHAQAILDILEE